MENSVLHFDIVVVGAGPAGLTAAIAAARLGKKVLLADQNGFLGGNAVLGLPFLGYLDLEGRRIVGGIAQEYIDRLIKKGACLGHRVCPKHNSVTNFKPQEFKLLAIEMCREAGVQILLHAKLTKVETENRFLRRVFFSGIGNGVWAEAKIFLDCTGDGSLAVLAGCGYELGDGAGEMQPPTVMFTLENVDTDRLYDYIALHPDEMTYSATIDHRPGYDAAYFKRSLNHVFVGLRTTFSLLREKGELPVERETLIFIHSLEPGEVFVNSTRLIGTDATDLFSITKAETEGQLQSKKLAETLKKNVPGFEHSFLSQIQPFIGVRETRRVKGIRYLTESEALSGAIPGDSVALAGYKIDVHSGHDRTTLFKTVKKPFGIPYGVLVAKDADNLMLAGRCVSCDKNTLAAIRVMPQCMCMGEAAGVGACLSIDRKIAPKDVNPGEVRAVLSRNKAILREEEIRIHPEDRQD